MHHTLHYFQQYAEQRWAGMSARDDVLLLNTHDFSNLNLGRFARLGRRLTRKPRVIFHRNEPMRRIPDFIRPDLLIDCLSSPFEGEVFREREYVPLGAVSFSVRGHSPRQLTVPLAEVRKNDSDGRNRFCSFLFRNANNGEGAVLRNELRELLSRHEPVLVPETNPSRESVNLFDDAVSIHSNYRFCIAFENGCHPGYVSEKLFNAYLAGCIPIYFGTDAVFDYVNRDAILYYELGMSLEAFADGIIELEKDPSLQKRLVTSPLLTVSAMEKLFYWHPALQS